MIESRDLLALVRMILSDVRVDLTDEFHRNFERQAFFNKAWQRRKGPIRADRAILTDSGALRKSIMSQSSDTAITFYSDLPYAEIHNTGGEITVTAKMKRFFRAKFYEAQGGFERKEGGGTHRQPLSDRRFYAWTATMKLTPEAEFWRMLAMMPEGKVIKIPKRQFIGEHAKVKEIVQSIIDDNLKEYFDKNLEI